MSVATSLMTGTLKPDIPGSRVAGGAHGSGGMLMVTAVRDVDAAGCLW
jgi:hypothetical protein